MQELLITYDSGTTQDHPWVGTVPPRHWWQADASQLYVRMAALEAELSSAMVLLELREADNEARDGYRSAIVTELMTKWRELIDAKPAATGESS